MSDYQGSVKTSEERRLSLFLKINFIFLLIAGYFNQQIGGFNLQGYIWIVALLYAVFVAIRNKRSPFPIKVLIPLLIYLFIRLVVSYSYIGLQSTAMILSPFIFGLAVSGFNYRLINVYRILKLFWQFTNVFILFSISFSIVTSGGLTAASSAALGMTITILAAISIGSYILYNRISFLVKFFILVSLQILAVTRMAIAMTLILLPLSFLRVKPSWRFGSSGAFLILLLVVFYSKPFQRKTFFSGQGSFQEISFANENFQTSGRSSLYNLVDADIGKDKLFGKGPGSDFFFLKKLDLKLTEFHNNYLTITYNYGIVGLVIFISTYIILFFMLYKLHRKLVSPALRVFSSSCLILFLVYFGFSYTDNILKYNLFFTNIHFAMIGLIYGWVNSSSIYESSTP
jgi:hypothetical protein